MLTYKHLLFVDKSGYCILILLRCIYIITEHFSDQDTFSERYAWFPDITFSPLMILDASQVR